MSLPGRRLQRRRRDQDRHRQGGSGGRHRGPLARGLGRSGGGRRRGGVGVAAAAPARHRGRHRRPRPYHRRRRHRARPGSAGGARGAGGGGRGPAPHRPVHRRVGSQRGESGPDGPPDRRRRGDAVDPRHRRGHRQHPAADGRGGWWPLLPGHRSRLGAGDLRRGDPHRRPRPDQRGHVRPGTGCPLPGDLGDDRGAATAGLRRHQGQGHGGDGVADRPGRSSPRQLAAGAGSRHRLDFRCHRPLVDRLDRLGRIRVLLGRGGASGAAVGTGDATGGHGRCRHARHLLRRGPAGAGCHGGRPGSYPRRRGGGASVGPNR